MLSVSVTNPIFNRARFREFTLEDQQLQRELISSFLRDVEDMTDRIEAACTQGGEAFQSAVHRLQGASHFVAAERLTRVLAALQMDKSVKGDLQKRADATLQILVEIDVLQHVLNSEVEKRYCNRNVAQLSVAKPMEIVS